MGGQNTVEKSVYRGGQSSLFLTYYVLESSATCSITLQYFVSTSSPADEISGRF